MDEAPKPKLEPVTDPSMIEIPEGAKKYTPPSPDGEEDVFGLQYMRWIKIDDLGGGTKEGVELEFFPHHIKIQVERLDLTAEEINEIGTLVQQLLLNYKLKNFVLKTEKVVKEATSDLQMALAGSGLNHCALKRNDSRVISHHRSSHRES